MYVIRSSTLITKKDGEFFPVYEENRKSGILAVFEHENDCVAVADRFNTIMYRHYGVDWETHPNAYAVVDDVDDLHLDDVLEVRQWRTVHGVFTNLCVDNAGRIERNVHASVSVLTHERSTAEWIRYILESMWEKRKDEEGLEEDAVSSTTMVELT